MNGDVRRGLALMAIGAAVFLVGMVGGALGDSTAADALQVLGFAGVWVAVAGLVFVAKGLLTTQR